MLSRAKQRMTGSSEKRNLMFPSSVLLFLFYTQFSVFLLCCWWLSWQCSFFFFFPVRLLPSTPLLPRYCSQLTHPTCFSSYSSWEYRYKWCIVCREWASKEGYCREMLRRTACTREYSERAQRIRRQELLFRQLRRLIIPGFLAYGLFILRPHEGHFLRYLAERRHHERGFNQLFLQATSRGDTKSKSEITASDKAVSSGDDMKKNERRWYSLWGRSGINEESDEARMARRRLLFARERRYSVGDSCESFRPIDMERRKEELASQREHPPMHLLSEELQGMMNASKLHDSMGSNASWCTLPVRLEFYDWLFFVTAAVAFCDGAGGTQERRRFIGFCGMIWLEL